MATPAIAAEEKERMLRSSASTVSASSADSVDSLPTSAPPPVVEKSPLYSGDKDKLTKRNKRRQFVVVVLTLVFVLGGIHQIFSTLVDSSNNPTKMGTIKDKGTLRGNFDYVVIIDAGSSGSRAHVFRHSNGVVDPEHESLKVKPGLSSYASSHNEAGKSLQGLFDFARKHIPEHKIQHTPVYLKATAGMRLLSKENQMGVMKDVRSFLKSSGFVFQKDDWAQIIPGEEEGLLGWMSVNYLNESPGNWGVMELGGASIQVTMKIDDVNTVPDKHERTYKLPTQNSPGKVYTHSFLGLGMESARKAVTKLLEENGTKEDPCLQKGYDKKDDHDPIFAANGVGSGNYDECTAIISKALFGHEHLPEQKTPACTYDKCLFNGLYAPQVNSGMKFWAFENFYYTPSALAVPGVPGETSIANFDTYAREICEMSWTDVEKDYPKDWQPKDINNKWCFGSTYIYLLLTKGLLFEPSQKITVSNNVGKNGIDWALGAALQAIHSH